MCGRYILRTPLNVLAKQFQFDLGDAEAIKPQHNIPPTTEVLAERHPRTLHAEVPGWRRKAAPRKEPTS